MPCILLVTSEYPPYAESGLGTHVSILAAGLRGRGCTLRVAAHSSAGASSFEDDGLKVKWVSIPSAELRRDRQIQREGIHRLNVEIVHAAMSLVEGSREPPEIIHCHDWYVFPAALYLKNKLNLPLVSTLHLLLPPYLASIGETVPDLLAELEGLMCRSSDCLIAVSEAVRRDAQAVYQVPSEQLRVVHNGCDLEALGSPGPPDLERLREPIAPDRDAVVLYAGSLSPQKGVAGLLRSAITVIKKRPETTYWIAGRDMGDDYGALVADMVAHQPILSNRVRLLGRQSRESLFDLYRRADLAIVPSVYEAFGYAALEPMAAGVPVVVTDAGGLPEVVRHGETGLVVPLLSRPSGAYSVDVDALAQAQLKMLSNRGLAHRLASNAHKRVLSDFTVARMLSDTVQVFAGLIASRQNVYA